ncbi:hypothetical protein LMH87_003903 [Akanthomyces muscarius]|uniref:Tetratricopeptide repeat protein n=1 Tax=Akanthomyces muscarius TaxID=2231603 RepID=A0A9W8Q2A6_AKAMU|nr:hypothetical protein LMH87_003903 [Akanthomyces muscarius]KAJ4145041.1 hypothetical protein LMH87_003903 [Akanthomyces muscarius]
MRIPSTPRKQFFKDEILDLKSLPRLHVEAFIHHKGDEFNLIPPAGYYASLMAYTQYIRDYDSPFQLVSPSQDLPGAAVLHDLGCIVMEASRGFKSHLAASLWFTATNWGYAPSACSLAAFLARSGQYGKEDFFAPAEKRFRALVKGGDPIAMAIEGEILYREGKYGEAETILNNVLRKQKQHSDSSAGGLRNWEPNFRLTLGKTLGKRGKTDQAVAILRRLSEDGYIEADPQLGKTLRASDPDEALQYLFKAGCTGALDCFEEMATIKLDKATKAGDSSEANDHRLWAQELTRLADKNAAF